MECPNCNRIYNDDFKFCPYCGTKNKEDLVCPRCGMESNRFSFCPRCGIKLIGKDKFKKAIYYFEECNENLYSGEFSEAQDYIFKALEIIPNNDSFWDKAGEILEEMASFNLKDYDEAIKCYENAIKIDPNNEFYWISKARCLHEKHPFFEEDYKETIECCDKALQIIKTKEPTPENEKHIWFYKYNALKFLGREEEAKECWEKFLTLRLKH